MKVDKSSELFTALIFQLAQSAYVSMGKIPSPFSGELERNLEVSRLTIDTLEAIETRTKGNLSEEEKTVFERILRELRMNYLDELKKPAEKTEEEIQPEAEAKDGEPAAATTEEPAAAPEKTEEEEEKEASSS
jgi:hypothetical protein